MSALIKYFHQSMLLVITQQVSWEPTKKIAVERLTRVAATAEVQQRPRVAEFIRCNWQLPMRLNESSSRHIFIV